MKNEVLSLIASFIAMAFVICSYFVKKKNFLLFQSLCIVFLIISYFFDLKFFAMVGLIVGLARSLTFYYYEKNDKEAPIFLAVIFSILTLASYFIINLWIFGDSKPVDIMYLVGLLCYIFIFRVRDIKKVRFLMLIPTVLSVLYNVLSTAPIFATLCYVFELSANVVSLIKYHVIKVKQ
jgi:hypothetical protein